MEYCLNLENAAQKKVVPLSEKFRGTDPVGGRELSFTNYYMVINGRPFLGISGECHYSRVCENQWEDTILKMKMGGINIISTYVFWIHHEEEEGKFCFEGNKNVRRFIELCRKHGMYVIMRIGPFDHGEVRNGGLPDWLYGKPFEVRSANEGFLRYTRRLYRKLAEQFEGLYFKDGGPIIGTQIDNEYMHSAAPWELTTGVTNEWVPGGDEGNAYMRTLKKIAREEGILTPFYTCTAWGGAATPTDELLPLWGGYAFWPWIYYDYRGPHPVTPEYIYRDYHNNEIPRTYNFEPVYEPESFPYACCEMGGGMSCYYYYRFRLPFESVDAMANIKLAGGCNFLGYYMYRGGSNPKGKRTPFLNESQCPKISYDYQAAIGEYGQLRPSYYRLKALHQFAKNFEDRLCGMGTVLPEHSQEISPEDVDTLRYAVRTDGKSGFLFLNNYQDHIECRDKKDETIRLKLQGKDLVISGISLKAGEEAILPFGMELGGYCLEYAKAQPLSAVDTGEKKVYFFFAPEGMEAEYVWDTKGITRINGQEAGSSFACIKPEPDRMSSYEVDGEFGRIEIVTLTREQSLQFYEMEILGKKRAVLCESPVTFDGKEICLESPDSGESRLLFYPFGGIEKAAAFWKGTKRSAEGIFTGVDICWEGIEEERLEVKKCGRGRYSFVIPPKYKECKDALLRIRYKGDVGNLFLDGELAADNFCNDAVWETGLKEIMGENPDGELTLLITSLKADAGVNVSSTMAGRLEQLANAVEELYQVSIVPVWEKRFTVKDRT